MFEIIADVFRGPRPPRERTPIRRQSRQVGRCEAVFWGRTDRRTVQRILLAARRFELAGKLFGHRNGPLGHVAIEILELFANLVDFRTGRLDPAIDYMQRKLRRSRDAIVRALAALRLHGFLDWLRRFEPTENEGRGPQVRQVSNAYRLALPAAAALLLGGYGATPAPDDVLVATEARAAEFKAHEQREFDDTPLGQSLARLKQSMKQRESARRSESQSRFLLKDEG